MTTIATSCSSAMPVSCSVKFPLLCCSPSPFLPSRISFFSARIPSLESISKRNWRIMCCSLKNALLVSSSRCTVGRAGEGGYGDVDLCVVSFYKFVSIEDPGAEVAKHQAFLQYSGPSEDALAYAYWLKEDPRFSDIVVQTSPSLDGHAFPRLKLRYKPSLVQYEGGTSHFPLLDPTMRATPLTPVQWRKKLQASCSVVELSNKTSGPNNKKRLLLLDVRNGYEWDIDHFQGADRPAVDSFRLTSVGLSSDETAASDFLAGADKENTDILMYCTGGIRCDVYSTILRSQVMEFRHRNCANLDCNKLFLCCGSCVQEFRGCCCSDCHRAPRLRPFLPGCQRYQKWHLYRDGDF